MKAFSKYYMLTLAILLMVGSSVMPFHFVPARIQQKANTQNVLSAGNQMHNNVVLKAKQTSGSSIDLEATELDEEDDRFHFNFDFIAANQFAAIFLLVLLIGTLHSRKKANEAFHKQFSIFSVYGQYIQFRTIRV